MLQCNMTKKALCASAKTPQIQKFAPVGNLFKSKNCDVSCASAKLVKLCQVYKFVVALRQHYTVQNLEESSVFSLTHQTRRLRDNRRKKAPNSCELGALWGRFDLIVVDCREGGRFWG